MFAAPSVSHFNWSAGALGYGDATQGVSVPAHADPHTKGADTAVVSAIAEDCYAMAILISGGSTITTVRRQLTDILIDPAGGTSWSVLINNLISNSPAISTGFSGWWYKFPIFLKAGTAIGARTQDVVGGSTLRVGVRVYGRPSRPERYNVGTKVQTLGADTSTTSGTAFTPGATGSMGSYSSSLGTLTRDSWWWQVGNATNDTSLGSITIWLDVAANATNKVICAHEILYNSSSNEICSKQAFGAVQPIQYITAGQDVYVRGVTGSGSADSTNTAVVYAVS